MYNSSYYVDIALVFECSPEGISLHCKTKIVFIHQDICGTVMDSSRSDQCDYMTT